jgi:hypothetical protein
VLVTLALRPAVAPAPERVALALVPTTRDAALPELALPPGTATLELRVPLAPPDLAALRTLTLVGPGGKRVPVQRTDATVTVDARALTAGVWELTLDGSDGPLAFFAFRVR